LLNHWKDIFIGRSFAKATLVISILVENEVIWGHIDIEVVVVKRLSRRWKASRRSFNTFIVEPPVLSVECEVQHKCVED